MWERNRNNLIFDVDCERQSINTNQDTYILEKEYIVRKRVDIEYSTSKYENGKYVGRENIFPAKSYEGYYFAVYLSINNHNKIIFRYAFLDDPFCASADIIKRYVGEALAIHGDFDTQPNNLMIIMAYEEESEAFVYVGPEPADDEKFSKEFDDAIDELWESMEKGTAKGMIDNIYC